MSACCFQSSHVILSARLEDLLGLCGDPRDLVPHHARSQQKGDGTPSAGALDHVGRGVDLYDW